MPDPIRIKGRGSRPHALLAKGVQPGEFKALDGDVAEISLYDEIGYWGVMAADFRRVLDGIRSDQIVLNLNSPGGDVFDGIGIYNDLIAHPANVTVRITGIAASIASIIAMAGDRVEIADNGFMMIHDAWSLTVGNKQDLRAMADTLEQIDGALADTYAKHAGMTADEAAALMTAETWYTGQEAVDAGLADGLIGGAAVNALFDFSVYAKTPAPLKRSVENGLREKGYSRTEAMVAVADGFSSLRDAGDQVPSDSASDEALRRLAASIRAAT